MLPHPEDLRDLEGYLLALDRAGVDAIIVASAGIMKLAKSLPVSFEVHVSTQHSTTNSKAAEFWKKQGMDRVVLARECGMDEIRSIVSQNIVPIEVFIHGGMCISYSGRCVLSNHMTSRDANRGGCAQSCRWKYYLRDGDQDLTDPDTLFSMSSKDLQAVDYMEDFIKIGVASLKIEGRMKSAYYLATVVSAYRRLIDHIYEQGSADPEFLEEIKREIAKAENRPTGPGFYRGLPDHTVQLYRDHDETVTQEYIASVEEILEDGWVILRVRNKFYPHIDAEVFGPGLSSLPVQLKEVFDLEGNALEVCSNPMALVKTRLPEAVRHAMIRKRRPTACANS